MVLLFIEFITNKKYSCSAPQLFHYYEQQDTSLRSQLQIPKKCWEHRFPFPAKAFVLHLQRLRGTTLKIKKN